MKPVAFLLLAALIAALPARADEAHHENAAAQSPSVIDGVVRKVDKEAQKITIRHGPVPSLDMPQAMTMVYRVKDPALLDKVKAGDKVKFEAENVNGLFTVTKIEPAK